MSVGPIPDVSGNLTAANTCSKCSCDGSPQQATPNQDSYPAGGTLANETTKNCPCHEPDAVRS
jgi:hypothetical protein